MARTGLGMPPSIRSAILPLGDFVTFRARGLRPVGPEGQFARSQATDASVALDAGAARSEHEHDHEGKRYGWG